MGLEPLSESPAGGGVRVGDQGVGRDTGTSSCELPKAGLRSGCPDTSPPGCRPVSTQQGLTQPGGCRLQASLRCCR